MTTWRKDNLRNLSLDELNKLEWVVGNGIGSYASGTVSGALTRSYHGILVASLHPPVERRITVSKFDETIVCQNNQYELGTNVYNKDYIHPNGFTYLDSFEFHHYPVFNFQTPEVYLSKTVIPIHGANISLVKYKVLKATCSFKFEVKPFVSAKDFHHVTRAHQDINIIPPSNHSEVVIHTYNQSFPIFAHIPGSTFLSNPDWYYNFHLERELERGLPNSEDLFCPGKFTMVLSEGDVVYAAVSLESLVDRNLEELHKRDFTYRSHSVKKFQSSSVQTRLAIAAEQFIVKREDDYSILAGYHWFSDWGRDAMIALPGICLATGKYNVAKSIIDSFIKHISDGMIPNRFPDKNEEPEYNTIDASLWLFNACFKYYEYTKDLTTIVYWIPFLEKVITHYVKGTRYNIVMDASDYLITGGDKSVQLTWMDAKIGDWVVTPRSGKCVEINALWFNALSIMQYFHDQIGNRHESKDYQHIAEKVKENFNIVFHNIKNGGLYDFISQTEKNEDIRPNQVYALALPFPVVDKEAGETILKQIKKELLTPRGLRSLNKSNHNYKAVYNGDVWQRDSAYHQGTVWSYLIGAYIDALFYADSSNAKVESILVIKDMLDHLDEAGIGTISEIFNGDNPHLPNGCIAQAWSVAELLRVMVEYDITENMIYNKKSKANAKIKVNA